MKIFLKKTCQFFWLILFGLVVIINSFETEFQEEPTTEYLHEWVAEIFGGNEVADLVAKELGFENKGKVI